MPKSNIALTTVLGFLSLFSDAAAEGTTCATVKSIYEDNQCCAEDAGKKVAGLGYAPKEGPMSSVMPGFNKPKLIMAVDVNYPPYAYLKLAPYESSSDLDNVAGVGPDMIKAMGKHCNFDVEVMQGLWADCWGNNKIGPGLLYGVYHGCMTYTHSSGVRNRYMEFTRPWAKLNKAAGLLVKLNNGVPHIKGDDNLNGKTILDASGWAPTAETLYFVKNKCTDTKFTGFTIIASADVTLSTASAAKVKKESQNDKALLALLDGQADALYIYADQAKQYHCADGEDQEGWNCELWKGFGTEFAYIQTGIYGWMHNGTTIAMAKKGSGVSQLIDPCFESFQKTKEYYDVCKTEHRGSTQINSCIPNSYFDADTTYKEPTLAESPYNFPTKDHTGTDCSTGYCSCPSR